MIFNILR